MRFYAVYSEESVYSQYFEECQIYAFDSKKMRDEWFEHIDYGNPYILVRKISRIEALEIIGYARFFFHTRELRVEYLNGLKSTKELMPLGKQYIERKRKEKEFLESFDDLE